MLGLYYKIAQSYALQQLQPEDWVFFTMGAKGLPRRAYAPWTLDTGWKPMLNNGCAVEMVGRLDTPSAPPGRGPVFCT